MKVEVVFSVLRTHERPKAFIMTSTQGVKYFVTGDSAAPPGKLFNKLRIG